MQQFLINGNFKKVQDYFCTLTGLYEIQGYYFVGFPVGENCGGKYVE